MSKILGTAVMIFVFMFRLNCIIIPYGNVSGTWTEDNSPYQIDGDITISSGSELVIQPGVQVEFLGRYRIRIFGRLLAEGSVNDSIRFFSTDPYEGWRGLRFCNLDDNDLDSCLVTFCSFESGRCLNGGFSSVRGGAVYCSNSSKLRIENCVFRNNQADYGGALALAGSDPVIRDCRFTSNRALHDGGAILCSSGSSPFFHDLLIDHNTCTFDGGGIFCSGGSSPLIRDCVLEYNQAVDYIDGSGGGLSSWDSSPVLEDVIIRNNYARTIGGGIECAFGSWAELTNVLVEKNQADLAGGIGTADSVYLELSATTIRYNSSEYAAGGMLIGYEVSVDFDQEDRCSIYMNSGDPAYGNGFDLMSYNVETDVFLDTFTVLVPAVLFANPLESFNFDIQYGLLEFVEQDVYVDPEGSFTAGGLTPEDPVGSIWQAIIMVQPSSLNPLTVHLADGVYSADLNDQIYPLPGKDFLTIQGASRTGTILDGGHSRGIFKLDELEQFSVEQMTVRKGYNYSGGGIRADEVNLDISNVIFTECEAYQSGGAIYADNCDDISMTEVIIHSNNTENGNGGGIYINSSDLLLSRVSIRNNHSCNWGAGIYFINSDLEFDELSRSSIYCNESLLLSGGNDIWTNQEGQEFNVIVDTFTVLTPDEYHVTPLSSFNFDILHAAFEPVDADLFVSPEGSNENSGLTPDDPLRNIHRAYQIITGNNTVHLAPGIYSPGTNGEFFPLKARQGITLEGAGENLTFLNGEEQSRIFNVFNSNVSIRNLTIESGMDDQGGGLYISADYVVLENLLIRNNQSEFDGGGVYIYSCDPTFFYCRICGNNSGARGGGLALYQSDPEFIGTSLVHNNSESVGGGIYLSSSQPVFNENLKSSIHSNHSSYCSYPGHDIASGGSTIEVIVDTFSVLYPNDMQAWPRDRFSFQIDSWITDQVEGNIYVSPGGCDDNSGLNANEPLKHVRTALERIRVDEDHPAVINLAAGTYSLATSGEEVPVLGLSYLTYSGAGMNNTVINGDKLNTLFLGEECSQMTIENLTLCRGKPDHTLLTAYTGGIYLDGCTMNLKNVTVKDCESWTGPVMSAENSEIRIETSFLIDNKATGNNNICSGLELNNCYLILNKVTLAGNEPETGNVMFIYNTNLYMVNSICWNPGDIEIQAYAWTDQTIMCAYNCIEGGQEAIQDQSFDLIWNEGNISDDPQFLDPVNSNYNLGENSQCIDSGIAYYLWDDVVCSDLSEDDFWGSAPDLGADEFGMVSGQDPFIPVLKPRLYQNFPNPFNPSTAISYQLSEVSRVSLKIYNIKGQFVKTLLNDIRPAGKHSVIWDGRDDRGRQVSSGVYFYRMKIREGTSFLRKCLLLK